MVSIKSFIVLFSFIDISFAGAIDVLPVAKCKLSDSECLRTEFQKALPVFMNGIPELGIEPMEPLKMDPLIYDVAGLHISLSEGKVDGIIKAVFENVEWNTQEKYFTTVYHTDSILEGRYVASGKILSMDIKGNGYLTIAMKDAQVKWLVHYVINKGSDGKDYVIPKDYDITYDVRGGATFQMTNLFGGNKELSDSLLAFLNKNWKKVVNELGKPIIKTGAISMYKNIVKFFKKYPLSDIAEY